MVNNTVDVINTSINQTLTGATQNTVNFIPFTGSLLFDLFIISLLVSIFITFVNKVMTDQARIKALKKEMSTLRKNMREIMAKDPKKAQNIQKEIMQKSLEQMKHSMNIKVLMLTMVPTLLIFSLVAKYYGPFGEFWDLGFTTFGWLGTYIVFSIFNSIIVRKLLKVA